MRPPGNALLGIYVSCLSLAMGAHFILFLIQLCGKLIEIKIIRYLGLFLIWQKSFILQQVVYNILSHVHKKYIINLNLQYNFWITLTYNQGYRKNVSKFCTPCRRHTDPKKQHRHTVNSVWNYCIHFQKISSFTWFILRVFCNPTWNFLKLQLIYSLISQAPSRFFGILWFLKS